MKRLRPSSRSGPPDFADTLLGWYRAHRRDLPWRAARDPYAIWVSEVMLQQTRVATVRGYYERWMRRFPTVRALAAARDEDVLHAWQGLGYYSRARNLLRGARVVRDAHGGALPRTAAALRDLPGIGPYSAGAIASIAYGERTPLVDGNVVRVLCRAFGLRGDPSRAPLKNDLWRLAGDLVPEEHPGDFNQALMELGATVCTPKSPACDACPIRGRCVARREGAVGELPETPERKKPIAVSRAAALVFEDGRVLVVRVPDGAPRWAGMWQFPNTDVAKGEDASAAAARAVREAVGLTVTRGEILHSIRHAVTHHRITLDVVLCSEPRGTARARGCGAFAWKRPPELTDLAFPSAHRKILSRL